MTVMYIVQCTVHTDKKHNINGKLTKENNRGFFHMQEYSFLLIPVYTLLQYIIILVFVCSKICYVLVKAQAVALDTYAAVRCTYTPYKIYRRLMVTNHHTMRLSQDTTCIKYRFYGVLDVIIRALILITFGFYLLIAN